MGLCATYVDDTLHAGNKEYQELSKETEKTFQCKSREYYNVQFSGLEIDSTDEGFIIHQKKYIFKLEVLE